MRRLLALLCLLIGLAALVPQSRAEPAWWSVTDGDSTVYLFGTFHILRPELDWKSGPVADAFAGSDELWLEVTGIDDTLLMQNLAIKYGLDPKNPLWRKLDEVERKQLAEAVKAIGLPWFSIQAYRPWLAALTISMVPAMQAGFEMETGADLTLQADAAAADKPVHAFETAEQQVRFFATLSPAAELGFLRATLADIAAGQDKMDALLAMWESGDVAAMEREIVDDMRTRLPEVHDVLIRRRNQAWSDRIAEMMQGSGTHFVAVGAAHLVGAEGLPALLDARGFTVTRQ